MAGVVTFGEETQYHAGKTAYDLCGEIAEIHF